MGHDQLFCFGEFTLEIEERRLRRGTATVHLAPKAFDVLVVLVRQPGRLVSKDELLASVWPDSFVEEGILTVHVSALRRALGREGRPPTYIETVARSGYRFVAPVTRVDNHENESPPPATVRPVELYEYVGRGRTQLLAGSYFELPGAVASFRAAIEIDGTYAPAQAGLARALCAQAELRTAPHVEAFAEAKALAFRALAIDSACVDAHVALGSVLFLSDWDWPAAERTLRRALAIEPAHTEALVQYGALTEALGKLDEGLQFKQQALARTPQSPWLLVQIAVSYWHQRKFDETLVWAQRALDVDPKHLLAIGLLRGVHWKRGDLEGFLEENRRRATHFGASAEALAHLDQIASEMRTVYADAGLIGLRRYMADMAKDPRLEFDKALKHANRQSALYADAGRVDEAFACLDRAIASRDPSVVYLAIAPQWDSLRRDPRFAERLSRLSLSSTSVT
jgi:DNA-binding winged helix-turn-helix (wHTH) protein/tetratricopeptide (TPR) repeat protein